MNYDGGLNEIYEDDTKPKKRGRRKKTGTEKKNNNPKPDVEHDELIQALVNGEKVDSELLSTVFNQYSSNIDLECDTTGMIGKLKANEPIDEDENNAKFVIQWCNKMLLKEEYSEIEMEAFEAIKELHHQILA